MKCSEMERDAKWRENGALSHSLENFSSKRCKDGEMQRRDPFCLVGWMSRLGDLDGANEKEIYFVLRNGLVQVLMQEVAKIIFRDAVALVSSVGKDMFLNTKNTSIS